MSTALQFESVESQSVYIAQEPAEDDPRCSAVKRVLTSACFSIAGRLSAFLSYVCERTLSGQQEDVTEQQIGVFVFGREPGFNTGENTIVRTTARAVRQKLDQYFYVEGQNDPIRIVIPKGTYIPEFQERPNMSVVGAPVQPPVAAPVPVRTESPAALPSARARQAGRLLGVTVVAAIFFACTGLVYWHFFHRFTVDQALWRQLFKGNQPVLLFPAMPALSCSRRQCDGISLSTNTLLEFIGVPFRLARSAATGKKALPSAAIQGLPIWSSPPKWQVCHRRKRS
jgi:hypothetical protein